MTTATEIASLNIKYGYLLPNCLNLCLLLQFLIETTQLIKQWVDKGQKFLFKIWDDIGKLMIIDEIQGVYKDFRELVFFLLVLKGVLRKDKEGKNTQELILIGDTSLCQIKDGVLFILFVLQHTGKGTKEVEDINFIPLRVTIT